MGMCNRIYQEPLYLKVKKDTVLLFHPARLFVIHRCPAGSASPGGSVSLCSCRGRCHLLQSSLSWLPSLRGAQKPVLCNSGSCLKRSGADQPRRLAYCRFRLLSLILPVPFLWYVCPFFRGFSIVLLLFYSCFNSFLFSLHMYECFFQIYEFFIPGIDPIPFDFHQ
jgi:hypothetical protein